MEGNERYNVADVPLLVYGPIHSHALSDHTFGTVPLYASAT